MTGIQEITLSAFTSQMLIDFKSECEELYNPTVPEGENAYLEVVDIPTYNPADISHVLITTSNGNWTATILNNSSYKHFFVEPGDYSSVSITLTQDGTLINRRSISLHNGNDIHPAALSDAQQANMKIKWDNASYWDIDRISFLSYQASVDVNWIYNGSSYNVLNRIHVRQAYYGIRVLDGCHYNTLQKSYINEISEAGRLSDNHGFVLTTSTAETGGGDGTAIIGTKIVDNDFKNCADAIQLVAPTDPATGYVIDYTGTIVDGNRMWVDNTIYYDKKIADGGVLDPTGLYSGSENGIDIKAGSKDPTRPVVVTNNIMWGFRKSAYSDSSGKIFSLMYSPKNIKIENNIMFDAEKGMATNKPSVDAYSSSDISIRNNIFFECNKVPVGFSVYVLDFKDAHNFNFDNNSFIECGGGTGSAIETNSGLSSFKNNVCIEMGNMNRAGTCDIDNTYLYNTTDNLGGTNDHAYANNSDANMDAGDYSFEYERYTALPKTKTLTGIISTVSSPHYGLAGSDIV